MRRTSLGWLFSLILMMPFVYCQAQPKIYALEIPGRISSNVIEHYNIFWEKIASLGLQSSLEIFPSGRLIRSFLKEQHSCTFSVMAPLSALLTAESSNLSLILSDEVDNVGLRIYTPSSDTSITDIASLENKRVAGAFHLNPSAFLGGYKFIDFKNAENTVQLLKMLYRRRVDAILAFTPDIQLASKILSFPMPYSTGLWIFKNKGVGLICHDTQENQLFIKQFNKLLRQLKTSGELLQILGPYAKFFAT